MKYDVLVIGAGLAGASAARILAEQNKKILVIEKNLYVGGNCYDERDGAGITVHRYGPHIFHTQSRILWQFVNRFSPFRNYQHVVKAYVDGMLVTFPINRDTICELFGASITADEVNAFLQSEIETASFDPEPKNFRDAIVSQVGERLYNKFFKNYTWKQWEQDPINLSVELAGRIPVRQNRDARYFTDPYQGIPEEGYTGMIQNMLTHENIELILGADYFLDHPSWIQGVKIPETVYTGPLDRYFDYEFGPLQYRSVHFDFQTLDQAIYQPVAVVNYPNDYDFTRITEFKHMTGETSDKTVICREYPSSVGYPSYIVLTEPNLRIREQYMKKALKKEVQDGVHFIGRLAEYKYYNMDQVIASAMATFKG